MKLRTYVAAIAATALVAGTAPAMAGPAETAFLERLAGIYHGEGQVTGGENGTVSCRLAVRPTQGRLAYTGRCAFTGGSAARSFNGVIRYNDATGTYESTSQGHTVTGKKNGSSLVFNVSANDTRGRGSSTLTFAPGSIQVQFEFVDSRTGRASKGSIPFRRS